jgi:thiol:disulfide interchange protein DsbD
MLEELLINLEKVFTSSPVLGLGASFLAGVVVSFSPCIYPLIPITLGVAGVESTTTRLKGFSISFVFVLGVACVYTTLGIISALSGKLLARFFVNAPTFLSLAVIFILLGIWSLKGLRINIPFFSFNREDTKNKEFFSIFILGMVSSLAIIPCNFPVLGAILSLISLKQNVIYGGSALFLFSLGYGAILIILGTFTSLIRKLPKQGSWLIIIKKAPGFIFVAMGIYFFIKFIQVLG